MAPGTAQADAAARANTVAEHPQGKAVPSEGDEAAAPHSQGVGSDEVRLSAAARQSQDLAAESKLISEQTDAGTAPISW